jgi:hypothetical protein
MKNQKNTILWIIGIAIFFLVVTKLPLIPQFALVTTTICADGVTNYYPLDGTFVDMKGGPDIINNGASFTTGKLGSGALGFNDTDSISFLTLPLNLTVGLWMNNYSNTAGWVYKTYKNTSILSSTAFFGLNGSVDEIVVGENITTLFSNIQPCYLTVYEENVSCKDYAKSQATPQTTGCLNYSGTVFPDCKYEWLTTSGFYIENNICQKRFYCEDILSSDFSTLALCQANLTEINDTTITPTTPPPLTIAPTDSTGSVTIAGYEIKVIHLIIGLGLVLLILFFMGAFKKK